MRAPLALSACLLLGGCSTSSGFLDAALPDRIGTGTAFGKGDYRSRSSLGEMNGVEDGTYDENIHAVWLEWDIPSFAAKQRQSFAGMRDSFVEDYREIRMPDPPKESLISITRSVDEATGDESWSFGMSEALNSALLAILSWLGFKVAKSKLSSVEPSIEDTE